VENQVKNFGQILYRATGREVGERSKRGKFWCDFKDLRIKIFTIYSKNAKWTRRKDTNACGAIMQQNGVLI
jgi:hypothetical protein